MRVAALNLAAPLTQHVNKATGMQGPVGFRVASDSSLRESWNAFQR